MNVTTQNNSAHLHIFRICELHLCHGSFTE